MSNKIINLKERVKEMMTNEGIGTRDIEEAIKLIHKEAVRFSDMPRNEQIDCFINKLSSHEFEEEIADMLSTLTAYNSETYKSKYCEENYFEHTSDTLRNLLNGDILDADDPEEEKAWNLILDVLGESTIFKCIDDDDYRNEYLRLTLDIREKTESMLQEVVKKMA